MNNKKIIRKIFDSYTVNALKSDKHTRHMADKVLRWQSSFLTETEISQLEDARNKYLEGDKKSECTFRILCKEVRTRLFRSKKAND